MTFQGQIEKQNDGGKSGGDFALIPADALALSGAERLKFLNAYNSQDVAGIAPMRLGYGAILTQKGKLVSDTWILNLGDSYLLLTEPGYAAKILEHLKTFLLFADVRMEDRSRDFALLGVWGENAPDFLSFNLGGFPESGGSLQAARFGDAALYLYPSERAARPGWEILAPRDAVAALCDRLRAAGFRERPEAELDQDRIAAGIPKMGVDMSEENLVAEVGLDKRATSFNKGCYLGQETTARINSQGHANRHLIRVKLTKAYGGDLPLEIRTASSDKPVGRLSSVAAHGEGGIGLGIVHRNADGEPLFAVNGEEKIELDKI